MHNALFFVWHAGWIVCGAAKSQKPKAKSQKPKAKSQKPKAKSQKPKAKSQKPKAKIEKVTWCSPGEERRGRFRNHPA